MEDGSNEAASCNTYCMKHDIACKVHGSSNLVKCASDGVISTMKHSPSDATYFLTACMPASACLCFDSRASTRLYSKISLLFFKKRPCCLLFCMKVKYALSSIWSSVCASSYETIFNNIGNDDILSSVKHSFKDIKVVKLCLNTSNSDVSSNWDSSSTINY